MKITELSSLRVARQRMGAINFALACLAVLATAVTSWAQSASYSVVYSFQCDPDGDGATPEGDLIADSAGNLYGTTSFGGIYGYGTVFKVSANGTETLLHSFAGPPTDGRVPSAGLVMDSAENLYGTTTRGGAHDGGTVFEISAQGLESILYSFTNGKDEGDPVGSLMLDSNGNLYGTTTGQDDPGIYYGTVFKLSASGRITELHTFAGPPDDGALPQSGLIHDSAGNLYGTTVLGGAYEDGTVFELSRAGTESIFYSFTGGSDGDAPSANLLRDAAGNLYGTASAGGDTGGICEFFGCGTVFELSPNGEVTGLYSFTGGADGAFPLSDLLMDSKGDLYSTTIAGGSSPSVCSTEDYQGCGVVFELTATGKERVLHTFTGSPDGAAPAGGLVRVGNYLYGTTMTGGASVDECGTVYMVAP
jgi:uncharacterized repeat protein (TIGR03803 family)